MEPRTFSVTDALVYGFKTFFDRIALIFPALLMMLGVGLAGLLCVPLLNFPLFRTLMGMRASFEALRSCSHDVACMREQLLKAWVTLSPYAAWFIISMIVFVILIFTLRIGYKLLMLSVYDTDSGTMNMIFSGTHYVLKMLGAAFLYYAMVCGGLVLFVIPGIYLLIRFGLYPYFILDKGCGVIESLRMSWEITQTNCWKLFGLWLLLVVLKNLVVMIALLGWFIVWPVSQLCYVYVYRQLVPRG